MVWNEGSFGVTATLKCNGVSIQMITGSAIGVGLDGTTSRTVTLRKKYHSVVLHAAFAPNGLVTAPDGSLFVDTVTEKLYRNSGGERYWVELLDFTA